jgi:hypothetical protein
VKSGSIVGARVHRSSQLHFVRSGLGDLARGTRVIVEEDGLRTLAFVALPAQLLVAIPEDAIRGSIIAVGDDAPEVAAAVAALDREALDAARELTQGGVRFLRATRAVDLARVTFDVEGDDPSALRATLALCRDILAARLRCEVGFQTPDGRLVELPTSDGGRGGFVGRRSRE